MCIEIAIAVVTSRCVVMGVACNAETANFLETADMGQMVSLCPLVFLLFPSPQQHSPLLSAHSPFQKGRCSIQGNLYVCIRIGCLGYACVLCCCHYYNMVKAWSSEGVDYPWMYVFFFKRWDAYFGGECVQVCGNEFTREPLLRHFKILLAKLVDHHFGCVCVWT